MKNPETVRLVATLAKRLNTTQVQAISDAVSARLAALDEAAAPSAEQVLTAIWNAQSADERQAVRDRQGSLYDESGLPS